MKKRVETLTGHGPISKSDGSEIGVRRYRLSVWQDMVSDGQGGSIPGMFSVEGHIDAQGFEGFSLLSESLTLKLEDGRSLPFFFSNSDGQIAARGALK
jgi:hypothetical protein